MDEPFPGGTFRCTPRRFSILRRTKACQPAMFVAGLAAVEKLRAEKPEKAPTGHGGAHRVLFCLAQAKKQRDHPKGDVEMRF